MNAHDIQNLVVQAVNARSMNSARTAQAVDYRVGASDLGQCRSFLWRFIRQDERHEREDTPWAAFVGTAVGGLLEEAVTSIDPMTVAQDSAVATFPSGRTVPGHPDLYRVAGGDDPGWVLDFKAKDGTRMWESAELDRSHVYQIATYWLALRQAGKIGPDAKAYLVYVDRSGKKGEPVVREVTVDDALIEEIDAWTQDAIDGVLSHEEPPRDRPYSWCEVACPFFADCRGYDETNADGTLIEDATQLHALSEYQRGKAMEKEGKAIADEAKDALVGVSGTAPGIGVLSWTLVNGAEFTTRRAPYQRMNLRKIKR